MFTKKDNFVIMHKPIDEKFVSTIDFFSIYKTVCDFFNFEKNIPIKIYFLYSINEFHFFSDMKHEKWLCAFAGRNNIIFLFSPSKIEQLTDHKKSEIPKLIAHELSHIIQGNLGFKKIGLFNEGISVYIAKQKENLNFEDIDLSSIDIFNNEKKFLYEVSPRIINMIISKVGKEKLLSFLNVIKNKNTSDEIRDIFIKYFL